LGNIITIIPSKSHISDFIYDLLDEASQIHTVYTLKSKTLDPDIKNNIKNYSTIEIDEYKDILLTDEKRQLAITLIHSIESKLKISFRSIICADRHISYYYMDNNIDYAYNQLTKDSEDYDIFHDIVYQLVLYVNDLMIELKPKYLLMSSSNFKGAVFVALANYYGIKSYTAMHSVLLSGLELRLVLVNQHNWFNFTAQEKFLQNNSNRSVNAKLVLNKYLTNPNSPIKLNNKLNYSHKIRNVLSRCYNKFMGRIDTSSHDQSYVLSIIKNTLKTFIKYKYQSKLNLVNSDLEKMNYTYFALGALPELTLLENAPEYIKQSNSVEQISRFIPFDMKLGVREHPVNVGRRPWRFHKHLLSLGNTVLLSFRKSPFEIMKNSDAVITINGTTGWEGLIYKKPVFYFESTFYDVLGLAKKLDNFQDLESAYKLHQEFIKNFDNDKYYDIILRYIQAEFDASYEPSRTGVIDALHILENDSVLNTETYNYWNK